MPQIRNEEKRDHQAVEELTRRAFYNLYVPGCVEHYLVHICGSTRTSSRSWTSSWRRTAGSSEISCIPRRSWWMKPGGKRRS